MKEEERDKRELRGGRGAGGRAQVTEEEGKVRAAEGLAEGIGLRGIGVPDGETGLGWKPFLPITHMRCHCSSKSGATAEASNGHVAVQCML